MNERSRAVDLFTDAVLAPGPTPLERAVARVSRIRGPRQILRRLRALIIANHRTMVRCETDDERRWTARVHTALRALTDEGETVLPDAPAPRRLAHRSRKRPIRTIRTAAGRTA